MGTAFDDTHAVWISLGETPLAAKAVGLPDVPDRAEGYVLAVSTADGKPTVVLKGHNRLGLLCGVCSLCSLGRWREGQEVCACRN